MSLVNSLATKLQHHFSEKVIIVTGKADTFTDKRAVHTEILAVFSAFILRIFEAKVKSPQS